MGSKEMASQWVDAKPRWRPLKKLVRWLSWFAWKDEIVRLNTELKGAVEYHEHYSSSIDRALGQPRNLDAPLLSEHLAVIETLMGDMTDDEQDAGKRDTVRWLRNLMKLHKST